MQRELRKAVAAALQMLIFTFRVHVQAVGFAAVVGGQVVVADGDVEGVASCDVVAQRLPVDGDQPGLGLGNLESLGGPHGFYEERRTLRMQLLLHALLNSFIQVP